MKLLTLIFFLFFAGIMNLALLAQEIPFKCLTPEVNRLAEEKDPSIKARRAELAEFVKQYIARKNKSEEIYIIPVVFHVVHNNGEENISKEQIENAVSIMTRDYRKQNADTINIIPEFVSIAADCSIEFRLANIDPNGNCTEGITRTESPLTVAAGENVKEIAPSWPRAMYLNIWVVKSVGGGAAAYAYYPGTADDGWDGILCTHSYIGSIGTGSIGTSRVLTHETGHYLNLPHTWGDSNDPELADNCNIDDGIGDTPNTIGHTTCDLYAVTCGTLDNVQNYMEYSYCYKMFTLGQKDVMRATLNSSVSERNNLWSLSNLIATGTYDGYTEEVCKPVAEFSAIPATGCNGRAIQFTDLTYNTDTISSYSWLFPGGNPSSSTDQNPLVVYDTEGSYDVSLTATNITGTDTKTYVEKIKIINPLTGESVPFIEGFESTSFPVNLSDNLKNWTLITNGDNGWARSTVASYSGSACLRVPNNSNHRGTVSSLISPNIQVDSLDNMTAITFQLAYAREDVESDEKLKIYVSTNCGETWNIRYSKSAYQLSTTGGAFVSSSFIPDAGEWRMETVNLGAYAQSEKLLVKFDCESQRGNSLYIDDINFSESTGIEELNNQEKYNFIVFPNPFNNELNISYDIINSESKVEINVSDVLGKNVFSESNKQSKGQYTRQLDITDKLEKGIYFVTIRIDNDQATQRIIRTE